MAETIRGINVVIGAETTGLQKALSDVNKKSRGIQSELRKVDKLLKLDPKNTELLAQKQKLLSDAVATTKEKLDRLKAAQKQVKDQFAKGEISEGQYRAFQREITEAEQKLKTLRTELGKTKLSLNGIGESMQKAGKKIADAGSNLTKKVTLPIAGIGAAALKVGIDFEAGMSEVKAISGATGEDFEKLKAKAEELGANTKFSASEAASGLKYMAMAGWDTKQMLAGIDGVMMLAAASGEDLGLVSDIVTDSMTAFGLAADQAGKFADILAAASSKSNTNVAMLGESFKYVAPVAGALGYSAEDTAVALGLMANAGIKASQSGTSLRSALTNLASPTKEMKK
ncbi:phage tail tape measure protein [Paenibacillus larvae]|nr:phage tail tape measure protein [Paenibacillus larvae]MDT2194273.1 phage tail tape measure protein [Paenibacillus larvae]MDT2255029.1 phage tail tape measure protein [Paenibacillus larvae]MDT2264106.1 phage tail tape measure protein [Paenibacillus larvae]MDT2276705.1 phage tail tape measure protein [Paenibacillus larvae]